MAAVTIHNEFGAQENKVCHCSHCFPIYLPWSDGTRCHDLRFLMLSFKPLFHSAISPSSRSSLVPLCFLPLEWYYLHNWGYGYFSWQSWFQLVIRPAQYFAWCTQFFSLRSSVACVQAPTPSLVLFYHCTASLVYPIVTNSHCVFWLLDLCSIAGVRKSALKRDHLRSSVADSF